MSLISVFSASLVLRRDVILATVGCETVVFRFLPSSGRPYPVFHTNRSQHRRDVISLTLLFALSSPWNGPLEPYLFSATIGLALRLNRLKLCPFFWFSAWAAHSAPSLVDICRASVFLSVSLFCMPATASICSTPCFQRPTFLSPCRQRFWVPH